MTPLQNDSNHTIHTESLIIEGEIIHVLKDPHRQPR